MSTAPGIVFFPISACRASVSRCSRSASKPTWRAVLLPYGRGRRSGEKKNDEYEAKVVRHHGATPGVAAIGPQQGTPRRCRKGGTQKCQPPYPFAVGCRGCTTSLKSSNPFQAGSVGSMPGVGVKGDASSRESFG